MDRLAFFQEAVLRICRHLAVEKALQDCLLYLQQYLPLDRLVLQRFEPNYGTMQMVATATAYDCAPLDILVPVSAEAKSTLRLQVDAEDPDVRIFNDPMSVALCREMLQFLQTSSHSVMVMRLRIQEKVFGSLVLTNDRTGDARYTGAHAELISLLREPFAIALSNAISHRDVLRLNDLLADDNRYLQSELRKRTGEDIVGADFGLKGVMESVHQVAALDSPVLLLGETGVGKDVIAHALHTLSNRKNHPFIAVNCGSIPDNLIDSELFGHEKGAFTGALAQKRGRFERADKGTIFLDEIGELPPQAQVRLLRVLQSKEIERVGGSRTIPLDIRIIAATNRNLEEMVISNTFREDLWFRLNVFPILIPPLRRRAADIPALAKHFIHLKAKELKLSAVPSLAPHAMDRLMAYPWPGNVRELQNVVERALIIKPQGPLTFEGLIQKKRPAGPLEAAADQGSLVLDDVVSHHIRKVLVKANGKIHGPGGAAELLGMKPSTLRNRMKKLNIVRPE
jgi:transcriptional regulator with GAF, ATPase, and Fis domain